MKLFNSPSAALTPSAPPTALLHRFLALTDQQHRQFRHSFISTSDALSSSTAPQGNSSGTATKDSFSFSSALHWPIRYPFLPRLGEHQKSVSSSNEAAAAAPRSSAGDGRAPGPLFDGNGVIYPGEIQSSIRAQLDLLLKTGGQSSPAVLSPCWVTRQEVEAAPHQSLEGTTPCLDECSPPAYTAGHISVRIPTEKLKPSQKAFLLKSIPEFSTNSTLPTTVELCNTGQAEDASHWFKQLPVDIYGCPLPSFVCEAIVATARSQCRGTTSKKSPADTPARTDGSELLQEQYWLIDTHISLLNDFLNVVLSSNRYSEGQQPGRPPSPELQLRKKTASVVDGVGVALPVSLCNGSSIDAGTGNSTQEEVMLYPLSSLCLTYYDTDNVSSPRGRADGEVPVTGTANSTGSGENGITATASGEWLHQALPLPTIPLHRLMEKLCAARLDQSRRILLKEEAQKKKNWEEEEPSKGSNDDGVVGAADENVEQSPDELLGDAAESNCSASSFDQFFALENILFRHTPMVLRRKGWQLSRRGVSHGASTMSTILSSAAVSSRRLQRADQNPRSLDTGFLFDALWQLYKPEYPTNVWVEVPGLSDNVHELTIENGANCFSCFGGRLLVANAKHLDHKSHRIIEQISYTPLDLYGRKKYAGAERLSKLARHDLDILSHPYWLSQHHLEQLRSCGFPRWLLPRAASEGEPNSHTQPSVLLCGNALPARVRLAQQHYTLLYNLAQVTVVPPARQLQGICVSSFAALLFMFAFRRCPRMITGGPVREMGHSLTLPKLERIQADHSLHSVLWVDIAVEETKEFLSRHMHQILSENASGMDEEEGSAGTQASPDDLPSAVDPDDSSTAAATTPLGDCEEKATTTTSPSSEESKGPTPGQPFFEPHSPIVRSTTGSALCQLCNSECIIPLRDAGLISYRQQRSSSVASSEEASTQEPTELMNVHTFQGPVQYPPRLQPHLFLPTAVALEILCQQSSAKKKPSQQADSKSSARDCCCWLTGQECLVVLDDFLAHQKCTPLSNQPETTEKAESIGIFAAKKLRDFFLMQCPTSPRHTKEAVRAPDEETPSSLVVDVATDTCTNGSSGCSSLSYTELVQPFLQGKVGKYFYPSTAFPAVANIRHFVHDYAFAPRSIIFDDSGCDPRLVCFPHNTAAQLTEIVSHYALQQGGIGVFWLTERSVHLLGGQVLYGAEPVYAEYCHITGSQSFHGPSEKNIPKEAEDFFFHICQTTVPYDHLLVLYDKHFGRQVDG